LQGEQIFELKAVELANTVTEITHNLPSFNSILEPDPVRRPRKICEKTVRTSDRGAFEKPWGYNAWINGKTDVRLVKRPAGARQLKNRPIQKSKSFTTDIANKTDHAD
jgi:hypothetical protein